MTNIRYVCETKQLFTFWASVCLWVSMCVFKVDQMTSGLGHNCKTRFVVFGDQNWGDLGGLHSNKSRPELTVSRLTARNAIRVATRTVMFLVWPRPELSFVVTRNETLSGYRNYMAFLVLIFLGEKLVGANFYAFCNYASPPSLSSSSS